VSKTRTHERVAKSRYHAVDRHWPMSGFGHQAAQTIAAVVCAAVPAAKTVYILASEYKLEEPLVAATVSITTLLSVATLLAWLYALSVLTER
jgi:predicted permease